MLKPELLRELRLPPNSHPQHKDWLSAASGLVFINKHLHVVADDEHHLCSFAFDPAHGHAKESPLQLVQLLEGELPQAPKQLKKAKPDLESLLLLPASHQYPHGGLLCLGSGGKANRRRGLSLPLSMHGNVQLAAVVQHDLHELYEPLLQYFDDLNIEGGFISGNTLQLLQRGNKGDKAQSACLRYDANHFIAWLQGERKHAPALQDNIALDFGRINDVPLCPTDAAALPGGHWVATLVAEDTDNSYVDGSCVGSALAFMDANNQLTALHRLHGNPKVEGVALIAGTAPALLLVTDADDPAQPSQLLRLKLP